MSTERTAFARPSILSKQLGIGLALALFSLLRVVSYAQWTTETYSVVAGWNAIWVAHDLSHTTIDSALQTNTDIEEVWRWNPPSGPQFVTDPNTPVQGDPNWSVWKRSLPSQSTLARFTANAAYLIKVRDGASAQTFTLKGRPVQPNYPWTTSGVNLVGFPTTSTPPTFAQFLANNSAFAANPVVLKYVGGPLIGSTSGSSDGAYIGSGSTIPNSAKNPQAITPSTEYVRRGTAYWVQANQYTDYYGPVAISLYDQKGLNYGRNTLTLRLSLRNATSNQSVTVSIAAVTSDAPPAIIAGTAIMTGATDPGKVASINPDQNTGYVYSTPPTVTISAPSAGTTATATANLDTTGKISSFTITRAGAGYGATTPTVTVTPTVTGAVPLKVRGALNPITSQYSYTSLNTASSPFTVTLAAGASTDLVLVVDRVAMGGTVGQLFASLLRITDSLSQTSQSVAVSAVAGDFSGLWSGVAMVNQVSQIQGSSAISASAAAGTATVTSGKVSAVSLTSPGSYYSSAPAVVFSGGGGSGATGTVRIYNGVVQEVTITNGGSGYTSAPTVTFDSPQGNPNATPASFPVPLLVHRSALGDTRLLQQAYLGSDGTTTTISTTEALFPVGRKPSNRISIASLPSDFIGLSTGQLGPTATVSFDVPLDYDSDSNPFVHRYHPDHDNLDSRFESKLVAGRESLTVRRTITLTFQSSVAGITDPAWGVTMLGGTYSETVTGLRSTPITVNGSFVLNRVTDAPTLITP
jgi:hypothetical protein